MSKEAGRASQQPATRECPSDVRQQLDMSKLRQALAVQARTTTRILLL
jgi:hypothetical protein